jgi:hypothetical protein
LATVIDLDALLAGCAGDSFDDGIRIDTELVPLAGPGGPVKPAVYEGGTYQLDRRWASPVDEEPRHDVQSMGWSVAPTSHVPSFRRSAIRLRTAPSRVCATTGS